MSTMVANPKPIKATPIEATPPATTIVPNNTPASSPPTPKNSVFDVFKDCAHVWNDCAIADDDDNEDVADDVVKCISDFQKCIEESLRNRFRNGGSNNSSNNSSVSRQSNLTLMLEQEAKAEEERARKRKEQEEQGILLCPGSPPADGSPLSTADDKNKNPDVANCNDTNNDEGHFGDVPPLPVKDFYFLSEVYNLDKRESQPSDRDWWLSPERCRLVW